LSCGNVHSCLVDKQMGFVLTFPNHSASGIRCTTGTTYVLAFV